MPANFYTDNPDLAFRLQQMDLADVVAFKEEGYTTHERYPAAPRSYADALDNYRITLEILGEICGEHIAPRAAEADEQGAQCRDGQVTYADATQDALHLLAQARLMGPMQEWRFGGLNLPESIFQMMVEVVSRAEAGLMNLFGLQEIGATINEFADEEIKDRFLPRLASGEATGAMALTEPDAGSDLGVAQTRAHYDEAAGVWRLNGVKRFITNGNAEVIVVLARSEEGTTDARGLSLFAVEADETVRVRRIENKLGIHTSPTCEVAFRDTPAYLIGRQRYGLIRYAMAMMNGARMAVAAQALGIAEAAYREARRYADKRIQFGRAINTIPAVYRLLLRMRADTEATRALLAECGHWVDRVKWYDRLGEERKLTREERAAHKHADRLAGALVPLAKMYAAEMANRVCYDAIQVHGGTGYMREFNVERHYRDARITSIYEGTSQLQVVAAIGGLLGHALDETLAGWAALDYPEAVADLHDLLVAANAALSEATVALRAEDDREVIDYHAGDLAQMAVLLVNAWLLLRDTRARDTRVAEEKAAVARAYANEYLPTIHALSHALTHIDPSVVQARELVLEP